MRQLAEPICLVINYFYARFGSNGLYLDLFTLCAGDEIVDNSGTTAAAPTVTHIFKHVLHILVHEIYPGGFRVFVESRVSLHNRNLNGFI
jgi:hypothetical protein